MNYLSVLFIRAPHRLIFSPKPRAKFKASRVSSWKVPLQIFKIIPSSLMAILVSILIERLGRAPLQGATRATISKP